MIKTARELHTWRPCLLVGVSVINNYSFDHFNSKAIVMGVQTTIIEDDINRFLSMPDLTDSERTGFDIIDRNTM